MYNTLSTTACLSIAFGLYRYRPQSTSLLWNQTTFTKTASFVCLSLGMSGFCQNIPRLQIPVGYSSNNNRQETREPKGFHVKCPFDFSKTENEDDITGINRITRHPMLWSLGITGIGISLLYPFPTQFVASSFPIVFALIGGAHKDYRYRRNLGGYLSPEIDEKTSHIPFLAIITGKQPIMPLLDEIKWLNSMVATLLALAICRSRFRVLQNMKKVFCSHHQQHKMKR